MESHPFITFREVDDKGVLRYYILQKEFPHNKGVVISQPKFDAICMSVIPGYNLFVIWDGTLRGNFIASYPNYEIDLQLCLDGMASWYYSERIEKDKKRYEKFKIPINVQTTAK